MAILGYDGDKISAGKIASVGVGVFGVQSRTGLQNQADCGLVLGKGFSVSVAHLTLKDLQSIPRC